MKKVFFALVVLSVSVNAFAQSVARPPRSWVDNYAKIVSLRGLVNPTAGAHASMKSVIEGNIGHTIVFDSARTYYDTIEVQQSIDIGSNTTLDLNGATVWFFGDIPNAKGFNIVGNNVTIKNGKIYWTSLGGFSQTSGEYGNPISMGEYDSVGTELSGLRVYNVNFKHDRTDNGTICIFGNSHDVKINGCTADTLGSGALVLAHWGRPPNVAIAPSATNFTTHPYDIEISNCTVNRQQVSNSEMISLSGAYNVKVTNCRLNDGKSFTQVYCGDFGYGYAKPTTAAGGVAVDKYTLFGQGISFENCWAYCTDASDAYNVVGKPDYAQTPALFDTTVAAMPVHFENCYAINSLGASGGAGWNIQNCRGVSVENCFATGMDAAGVLIGENAWNTRVKGGLYYGNVYGVLAAYGTDSLKPHSVIVDGVHFYNNSGADVQAGFSNGMIYGCTFGDTLQTSTSSYAVLTTSKAYNINIIGNEVQSVVTAAFLINNNSSAASFNNYVKSGITKYSGVTPNSVMGTSGETFQLPPGAVIQPSSSYLLFRAINNTLRFQYNAGTGAIAAFYGADTDADVQFFEDSALFSFGTGSGSIKLYNSTSGSITLSGAQTGSNVTYNFPSAHGTAGQVLADSGTAGGLYWTSSGGGGGTFTKVGSMTVDPAFFDATASDDWLGMGATAGRIGFKDGTTVSDTIFMKQASVQFLGTDTNYTDCSITEGATKWYATSSTSNLVAQIQNGSNAPLTLNRYANEGYGMIINKVSGLANQSASLQLNNAAYKGDAYIAYKDSASRAYYQGIKSFDSGSFVLCNTRSSASNTDSLQTGTASLAQRYNNQSYNWITRAGSMFDIQDSAGNSQFRLQRSGTQGWWSLKNLDQIGDSTGYFKFINGFLTAGNAIYPASTYGSDTVTSFNGVTEFNFNDAYGAGPAATCLRAYNFKCFTTDPSGAGNDSTMNWVAFRDSSSLNAKKDTVIGYVDIPYTHKLDSIVCLSSANAANDSLEIKFFRGPRIPKTDGRQDSTYNATVLAAFHPVTNTAMTDNTNSKVTGTTLVGADKLLPPGRYEVRIRTSLAGTSSAVRIERLVYYWRNR